ncbi:hypothetical protein Tsubulata_011951 [Turnera subulata]|uniref:Uncharacterized protein n=1 Tax=Turnera subulata TaxID=218843 RepID=A0A9Q0GK80_9ROSI|nr:hypothetical protein Tsubulata_011951 [Turnera subulata]
MAGWASNNQKMNSRSPFLSDKDILMGTLLSPKSSGIDLMQNCDLPPPQVVFSGSHNMILSSLNEAFNMKAAAKGRGEDDKYDLGDEKLELLKALRLSQTRAREAERKAASLVVERDRLSAALLKESMQLFAYRQWVRLLEVQVLMSQRELSQSKEQTSCGDCGESEAAAGELLKKGKGFVEDEDGIDDQSWIVALVLCLGFVGFAFGYLHLF